MASPALLRPFALAPGPVESVKVRTDYRVGALTFNAIDLAKSQADLVGGDVVQITTRETGCVVYRAAKARRV